MSVASAYLRWRSSSDTPMVAIMVYTHAAVKLRRYASRLCAGFGDGALWAPLAMASQAGRSAAWHAAMSPAWWHSDYVDVAAVTRSTLPIHLKNSANCCLTSVDHLAGARHSLTIMAGREHTFGQVAKMLYLERSVKVAGLRQRSLECQQSVSVQEC